MNMMAGLCIYCGYRVVARSVRCFAGTYLSPCSRGSSALRTALENPQALRWRDGAMARRRAVVPPASPPMPRRRIAWDQEVAPLRWRPSWAMRRPGGGGGTDGSPATVARRPTLLSLSSLTGLLHAAGVGDEGLLVDLEAWRLQWVHASKAMACSVQRPLVGGAGMGAAAFAALGERQVTIVGFAGISLEAYALCLGSQLAGNTGVALSVKMVHLSDVQGLLRDVADAAERRFGELAALAERGRVDPVAPIARASLGSGEMQLLATSTAYSAFLYACQMSPFCFYRFAILYLALLIGLL